MKSKRTLKPDIVLVLFSLVAIIVTNVALVQVYVLNLTQKQKVQGAYIDASIYIKPLQAGRIIASLTPTPVSYVKIPIIVYHYVEYVKDKGDTIRQKLNTNPDQFENHLRLYKDGGYESYFMRDIPDILSGKIKPTRKPIVLTFDDGYEDFYTDALPILEKYNTKATAFIVPNFIGKPNYMSEAQFANLVTNPLVEIASHTLDHMSMKGAEKESARRQLVESKRLLEEKYHLKVETFAYPYGSYTPEAVELVKEAGYKAAASEVYGSIQSEKNIFYLSRIRPGMFYGATTTQFLDQLEK